MKDTEVICTQCGRSIEVCYFCEEPDCQHVVCREDLDAALGQAKPRTFTATETP